MSNLETPEKLNQDQQSHIENSDKFKKQLNKYKIKLPKLNFQKSMVTVSPSPILVDSQSPSQCQSQQKIPFSENENSPSHEFAKSYQMIRSKKANSKKLRSNFQTLTTLDTPVRVTLELSSIRQFDIDQAINDQEKQLNEQQQENFENTKELINTIENVVYSNKYVYRIIYGLQTIFGAVLAVFFGKFDVDMGAILILGLLCDFYRFLQVFFTVKYCESLKKQALDDKVKQNQFLESKQSYNSEAQQWSIYWETKESIIYCIKQCEDYGGIVRNMLIKLYVIRQNNIVLSFLNQLSHLIKVVVVIGGIYFTSQKLQEDIDVYELMYVIYIVSQILEPFVILLQQIGYFVFFLIKCIKNDDSTKVEDLSEQNKQQQQMEQSGSKNASISKFNQNNNYNGSNNQNEENV